MAQSRSESTHARPRRKTRPAIWTVIGVLLAVVLVGTLWVPFYNRTTPAWGGWPFFYWYQLLWVPIVAVVAWCAYLLSKLAQGGPAAAAPDAAGPAPDGGQAGPGDAPLLPKRIPPTAGGD